MAGKKERGFGTGKDEGRGADRGFYEMNSGLVIANVGMSNEITGTPPPPRIRGNTDPVGSSPLPSGGTSRYNKIIDNMTMEKE